MTTGVATGVVVRAGGAVELPVLSGDGGLGATTGLGLGLGTGLGLAVAVGGDGVPADKVTCDHGELQWVWCTLRSSWHCWREKQPAAWHQQLAAGLLVPACVTPGFCSDMRLLLQGC